MDINPGNVLSAEHAAWLGHPVTIQMLKNLEKFSKSFMDMSVKEAGNLTTDDKQFRINAYGMRTTQAIKEWISTTDKFIQLTEKK